MTQKQELQRRILSKVTPISREPTVPTQLPQLPHNHQKGVQCRSCRTLRKIAREDKEKEIASQAISLAKDATIGIATATVHGTLEVVKEAVHGIFDVNARIAGNADPVAQGIAIAGEATAFGLFAATPLGEWLLKNLGLSFWDKIGFKPLPPQDPALGPFGLSLFYFSPPGKHEILAFDTFALRQQAYDTITKGAYELLHGISEVHIIERSVNPGREGPFTEDQAFIRSAVLGSEGIRASESETSLGFFLTYTPTVGPWVTSG